MKVSYIYDIISEIDDTELLQNVKEPKFFASITFYLF